MKLFLSAFVFMFVGGCVVVPFDSPGQKAGGDTALVCHKGKKTMELPRAAVRAHLDHGDSMGPC